jgi:hypothetical protein
MRAENIRSGGILLDTTGSMTAAGSSMYHGSGLKNNNLSISMAAAAAAAAVASKEDDDVWF